MMISKWFYTDYQSFGMQQELCHVCKHETGMMVILVDRSSRLFDGGRESTHCAGGVNLFKAFECAWQYATVGGTANMLVMISSKILQSKNRNTVTHGLWQTSHIFSLRDWQGNVGLTKFWHPKKQAPTIKNDILPTSSTQFDRHRVLRVFIGKHSSKVGIHITVNTVFS